MSCLIAPSLLSADFSRLGEELTRLGQVNADWVHWDVMDGAFVPNITLGPPIIKALRSYSTLPFDVHLMIQNADLYLEDFKNAGADIITVHAEACTHLHRTLTAIRQLGCKAGVSLNPATPVSLIENVMDELDMVLVMSVNPGFGGQSFIPRSLEKIKAVRQMIGDRPIHLEVDGGINAQTAGLVKAAGADVLVAGSAVYNAPDMATAIEQLRTAS